MKSAVQDSSAPKILICRFSNRDLIPTYPDQVSVPWTYLDEDYMGKIARIAQAAVVGRGPLKVGPHIVYRYMRPPFNLRYHLPAFKTC